MGFELRLAINAVVRVVGDRERDGGGGLGAFLNAGACIVGLREGCLFMYAGRFDNLDNLDSLGSLGCLGCRSVFWDVHSICACVLGSGLCFLGAGLRGCAREGG